ncbi:MAG: hypothetical protein LBR06_06840 [Bacteroidales bacterium]|jgi:3-oxoacyl-[acyl-carrier-protein] synthase-1|nr:hypothetical protein [Bacteroidales bacterium]
MNYSYITPQKAGLNSDLLYREFGEDDKFTAALYRAMKVDYPKFFKMDNLSRLGFLASELLFSRMEPRFVPRDDIALLCFSRSASLDVDTRFLQTTAPDNYFPAPSLFVYTLANIVAGEITIRNKLMGESTAFVCREFDAGQILSATRAAFGNSGTVFVAVLWAEYFRERKEALMLLLNREEAIALTINELGALFQHIL